MFLLAAGFMVITIGLLIFQPGSNRAPDPVFPEPVTRAEPAITPAPRLVEPEPAEQATVPKRAPIQQTVTAGDMDDQSLRKMTWGTLSSLNQATGRESAPGEPGSLLHTIVRRSLDDGQTKPAEQERKAAVDGPQLYVVQVGDSLVSIAEEIYGDVNMTGPLFVANQSFLSRPDDLRAGQTLILPTQ
ncbi:LysM peptidoglycan-binding domain-containing protein [Thalassococcus lentus]|uniref:LysM peptidoglycan-binding domain-containing protein n=1 Tax=Thalassococcus lentus TaxID=1210524 RepID=A0ABT4XNR9_9RHOB|nr:LysM peptidoglycan-binding domain-containing protein [Thalassococcus lentus]MDA7423584.1 LysM peptidoglycan-binding domain-containing protein [Thalassococcus lentus]